MTLFDLDARVPLIIAAPGVAKSGTKTRAIAEMIDVYPTLVALCGLPPPDGVDGTSLVPILRDPAKTVKLGALSQHPRPALYWNWQKEPSVMGYSLRTARWCYTEWRDYRPIGNWIFRGIGSGRGLCTGPRDRTLLKAPSVIVAGQNAFGA
jgi:iduronate 2-sulfatase